MRLFCVLTIFLATVSIGLSQTITNPERYGISSQRLQRIDNIINQEISDDFYAGRSILIARNGKIVYFKTFGMADREAGKALASDTIFRQASMSKIITATALMLLYEEGKFLLDDPVYHYIPELKDPLVLIPCQENEDNCENYKLEPARNQITIRHLLTHTSGMTYGFMDAPYVSDMYKDAGISDGLIQTQGTLAEGMKKLATMPLVHHPGDAYHYSLSIDMVGYLVERLSDQPLDQFMQERIFDPLGMSDTSFFLPESKRDRLSAAFEPDGEGGLNQLGEEPREVGSFIYAADYHYNGPQTYFSGGAGLLSTMTDYYRFLQMLLNGGSLNDHQILSPSTIATMTANHTGDMPTGFPGNSRGLGLSRVEDPAIFGQSMHKGSYSWGGFWATGFIVDPERNLILIDMTQTFPIFHLKILERMNILASQTVITPRPRHFKK